MAAGVARAKENVSLLFKNNSGPNYRAVGEYPGGHGRYRQQDNRRSEGWGRTRMNNRRVAAQQPVIVLG